ncbi:MAG: 2-polyprenyl-3-methyl-5-hydroxy-6-metoxy-1,4-benzoquinol methylase [Sulfurimonas sp.]|jgi:2-polyprenyl-3-methyl-5-hydroxy-6-metoxy-1,4-benzoquinol methylase|uniref:class I SAM-dependent methyltransferase n=1 Tax=Sulfurimonas sp. TaxID=2022749 RepID=UPI0039E707C0
MEIVQSDYGYFSIKNLPTQKELQTYYSQKYYQEESIQYSHEYTHDELQYFKSKAEVAQHIFDNLYFQQSNNFLDIGTGEGFFAKNFHDNNWDVTTLDYSAYGINYHNPELLHTLIQGDLFQSIEGLCQNQEKYFNFINLSNILEHVIDPIHLLKKIKSLLSDKSLLRISVPNDYSAFQDFLLSKNYTTNTWLCPPEHLHYFTFNSLAKLLKSLGYEIIMKMGEFPIELYLTNNASNYVKDKEVGKLAHTSRVEVDNFLYNQGIENYINYYKACAEIGLTRQVVIYAKAI